MGDNEKVLKDEYEFEGMFADIISALDSSRSIVCTASKLTDEKAKKALFEGVKITLANCISAIEDREKGDSEPVIEDD
jgi:molecular chaperone GrpE (heat shock protein)